MHSSPKTKQSVPSATDINNQLNSILNSSLFLDSPKLGDFLSFVVNESLAGRAGRIKGFTIAQEVFGRKDPEDAQTSTIVRVEARRLRKKLASYYASDYADGCVHIEIPVGTYVPNFLYSKTLSVEPETDNKDDAEQPSATSELKSNIFAAKRLYIFFAALLLIFFWYMTTSVVDNDGAANQLKNRQWRGVTDHPSIAVMPFINMMDDRPNGDMLSYGLTEDIITDLSRLMGVEVVALSSVAAIGADTDLATIAEILNVSHVLRGSIRGKPKQARITAQLFETRTNSQVWAERYDREIQNALIMEDELATLIANSLLINLDIESLKNSSYKWKNTSASSMFSQALQLVNPPINPARLIASRIEFERIIELEPEFSGGYAGVAYTSAFMAYWRHDPAWQQYVEEAIEYANKAIELDENSGLAYSALAFAHWSNSEFDAALSISDIGVTKQPNDPYVNAYHGLLLAANGQAIKGISFVETALFLDPLNPRTPFLNILGFVQILANEPSMALESLERSFSRGGPVSYSNTVHRVIALMSLGKKEEAKDLFRGTQTINPSFGLGKWLDWVNRTVRHQKDRDSLLTPLEKSGLL